MVVSRHWRTVFVASAVLLAVSVAALCLGYPAVSPLALISLPADPDALATVIVSEVRGPRLVVGIMAGASFGVAGLLLQESLRNPLAVPEVLGASSGASLVAATIVVWGLPVPGPLQPVLTLLGALGAGALTLAAARRMRTTNGVLLIGIAISSGVTAVMLSVVSLADNMEYQALFRYLSGSLYGVTWADAIPTLPWLALTIPLCILAVPAIEILRLGDEAASSLGARPVLLRYGILGLVCVVISVFIAVTGPISWVGFLAPVLTRTLLPAARGGWWLASSAIFGALLVAAADLLARFAFYPIETPVGGWTAVTSVGVGAAIILLTRRRGTS